MLLLILICAILIGTILIISLYTFYVCFYAPKNRYEDPYTLMHGKQYEAVSENILACTKIMDKADCEWVYVTALDGVRLAGRYYHSTNGAPLLILFHGYRSMALRDCAGGYILGKKLGFNILAVDQRAHAESGGGVITFGIRERYDCLSWTDFAVSRFGKNVPIILSGLSMGAATILMASELDLPENVVGILADCPYSSPAHIIRKVCRDRNLPDTLAYPFIRLGAKIYGCFDLEETSAEAAVRNAKIPILIVHGEDDRFVPCQMSKDISSACSSYIQLHTFPDAGHGLCYMVDPLRYESISIHFLWKIQKLRSHLSQCKYAREILNLKSNISDIGSP